MNAPAFPFLEVAAQVVQRLQKSLASKPKLEYLLAQVGWRVVIDPADLAAVANAFTLGPQLTRVVDLADQLRQQRGEAMAVATELTTAIKEIFGALADLGGASPAGLAAPFNQATFWAAVAQDLPSFLVVSELQQTSPVTYALLVLTGVVQQQAVVPSAAFRIPYDQTSFQWHALGAFLSSPVEALATRYGWGNTRVLDHQKLLHELLHLSSLLRLVPRLGAVPAAIAHKYYTAPTLSAQQIKTLVLPFVSGVLPDNSGGVELGLSLTPVPAAAKSGALPSGILLAPYLHGSAAQQIPLRADLLLSFKEGFASDNAIGVEILPQGLRLESDAGSTALGAEISLVGSPATPLRFFGTDKTSRLELTGYALSVGVTGTAASPELLLRAGTSLAGGPGRLVLYLEPGDGDSFMAQAFGPDPIKLEVGGALTWSSRTGLGIDGAVGLHLKRAPNKTIGPLTLHDYSLDIDGQTSSQGSTPLTAALTLGGSLRLGPVTATVEKIGVTFQLSTLAGTQKGLLDNLDVHWGFKGPKGVGISVDSDAVTGGGYLFLDPAKHQYAGAANLHIKAGTANLNVNALGILQTELPGYPDDYSLLLLLTATFTPVQLGLGFTLNGLGGLLGVNRQADVEYLRGLVRQSQLKQLLFADNVAADPAAALTLIDSAFPVARGRYTIGLMAQLGWGSVANVLTLDVALLLELPKPIRVLLLGVLQAVLPNADNEKLKLRADFLGVIDTGAKKISFDAALSGSHILGFTLTGDMAFRLYQGDNPLFVITAGGFHPSFQPPAGAALTGLRRLTLALNKDDLQATLTSYYAVTSNTVQFGARLAVVYQLSHGFHVDGYFGFDVLFQFSPFRLLAHVEAGVAIKRGSREYLSLHLSLDVSGPGPWHIWGSASFHVICWTISVDVDATIGAAPAEAALPAPDVHKELLAALRTPTSWEVEAPPTAALPGGVALRPAGATAGQLFLDPRGALVLRQRVVPLGLALQKFGTAPTTPTHGTYFELTQLKVGDATYLAGNSALEETRDFFAPDQFRRLTDAQRLSSPSFQSLPNGLRLKRLNGLVADPHATRRVVEYEQKLLSGASGGSTQPMQAGTYRQLAQGAALGREVAQAQPSARAAQPVHWGEDTYEVVCADTLLVYDAGHAAFKTQAEAAQYCQALEAADPSLEVLVVPTYQLALA